MTRNSLSICSLAITAFLSACGGGGGGTATIDTPVRIDNTTFARVASLAVRSNLIVADSPNFNEGYPAAIVASAPPPSINLINLSRMQLVEISKIKSNELISVEAPIGAAPVNGPTPCLLGGSRNKTYTDLDNELTTIEKDNKLVIVYTDCKLELTQEANNCLSISETDKKVTLNGKVETLITAVTSATVFTSQLTYTDLNFTTARGSATINGKLLISLAATSPHITLTTVSGSPLTTSSGGVTERLQNATIRYNDNQQGCSVTDPNNNQYTILAGTTGQVASSDLGYVNVTVSSDLVGDSDSPGGGFPDSGIIDIQSDDATKLRITAKGNSTASVEVNNTARPCTPTWLQIFSNTLPTGC